MSENDAVNGKLISSSGDVAGIQRASLRQWRKPFTRAREKLTWLAYQAQPYRNRTRWRGRHRAAMVLTTAPCCLEKL